MQSINGNYVTELPSLYQLTNNFTNFFKKSGKADRQDGDKVEDGARRTL